MSFEKLFYKGTEIKLESHNMSCATLYLAKDGRHLDMRFKSNKEYYRLYIHKTLWQKIKLKISHWWFIYPTQWYYKWKYRKGIILGNNSYGVKND